MFEVLDRLPVPVVARIQGAALGGGAGLTAVSDIAVAADNAIFGFTEVKLGILPAVISPYVLAKTGLSPARELFLTGERFSASRARDIGLVHRVVPLGELDAAIDETLRELAGSAPGAMSTAKALLRTIANRNPADVLALTAETIARQRASAEGQHGMKAFLEKRKPDWNQSS
jgi:methylglutaconyl-CoA hydratase